MYNNKKKMVKKNSLLEQANVEEKNLFFEKQKKSLSGAKNTYVVIKKLLPSYTPSAAQEKWHKAKAREKGLKGGYGSGKTMAFCAEAIALAYINRPYWIILSSPSEDNALMTVLPHLKSFCNDNGLSCSFTKDLGHFVIDFGDTSGNIFLIGQKFVKGPNVAAIGMDEPFSQRKETYDNLIARVRHTKAEKQEIFWAGTPEPDKMEWGHEYFEKDSNDVNLFSITMSTYQNKYLSAEYIETLTRKYDAKMKEVYLMGKYISLAGGKVYYGFDRGLNLVAGCPLPVVSKSIECIVGFDFNVDPMCAVLLLINENRINAVEEFKIHNSNTRELCEIIISRLNEKYLKGDYKSILITGDAIGQVNDYMIIKDCFARAEIKHSVYVDASNPAVRDRTNLVNKLFEVNQLRVSEECKHLIRDLELVIWKQGANGFFIDKGKKDLSHLSDAFGYAVWLTQRMFLNENADQERPAFKGSGDRRKKY